MIKKVRLFPLVLAALSLAACQSVVTSVDGNDITGIYYLTKVDGSAVPAVVSHDGVGLKVSSGTFIISDDGTCFSRTRFIPPQGEEITREVSAQYRVEGFRLIMQWEGAGTTEGTIDGYTFTMDNHGIVFEYTKTT